MRGEGGVAGEGRVVGLPKFHSWGKCTMPLTNINSDWMSNASSGLCINLVIYIIHEGPLSCILGCNVRHCGGEPEQANVSGHCTYTIHYTTGAVKYFWKSMRSSQLVFQG